MKKIISIYTLAIGFALCLAGCQPSTEITASWKSLAASNGKIDRILVTAMTSNINARQTVETDLEKRFEKNGIQAVKSIEIMPPKFANGEKPDKDRLLNEINGTGVDAILTVALLHKESANRYVPGTYGYQPVPIFGYYGRFWGYFYNWYPTLFSPGYYAQDKVYFLETNLYNAKTEELLWSAQSETYNPNSLPEFSKEYSDVILSKLDRDGLISI